MKMHPARRPSWRIQGVDRIPQDWCSQRSKVGPQLVGTTRQRLQPKPLMGSVRDGGCLHLAPSGATGSTRGMKAIAGRATLQAGQRNINPSPSPRRHPLNICHIQLGHAPGGEQPAHDPQHLWGTRNQQQTGCITIQSMHQRQPRILLVQPGDERVSLLRSKPWLSQQSCRFFHHEEPRVLMHNRQRVLAAHLEQSASTDFRAAPVEKRQQIEQGCDHREPAHRHSIGADAVQCKPHDGVGQ